MARCIGVTAKISYKADASGSTYTVIPMCTIVSTPKVTISKIDTTNLGITDNAMTAAPGMADPGTLEFTFQFDADVYDDLNDKRNALEMIEWKVESPTGHGATWDFDAYIQDMDQPFEPNSRNLTKVTLQISGLPVYEVA